MQECTRTHAEKKKKDTFESEKEGKRPEKSKDAERLPFPIKDDFPKIKTAFAGNALFFFDVPLLSQKRRRDFRGKSLSSREESRGKKNSSGDRGKARGGNLVPVTFPSTPPTTLGLFAQVAGLLFVSAPLPPTFAPESLLCMRQRKRNIARPAEVARAATNNSNSATTPLAAGESQSGPVQREWEREAAAG
ncbi:hypothetical protein HPB48_018636 [Haemaphysalis longicornis]|uniref:Uncharacterized protein n=1 Tax=Haemaphysalis longicornis TaxID=44386 RepID=A0A9J6GFY5_HAELO|nr:hypothetical protein HPB48_018636 [Haemaphysalis longicornis]